MYIDAHCHILAPDDITTARAAGVCGFICNSARAQEWACLIDLSEKYDFIWPALGIHPWNATDLPPQWDKDLLTILSKHQNYMVGEIGIDKNKPNIAAQQELFIRQLEIAHSLGRTAHIHCIGAWDIMLRILKDYPMPPAMVFHSFSVSRGIIDELMRYNAYFSYPAAVLNPERRRMRESVIYAPLTRILVESDAPGPGRSPSDIPAIVCGIAKLRGIDNNEMTDIIYTNTQKVLSHGQIS